MCLHAWEWLERRYAPIDTENETIWGFGMSISCMDVHVIHSRSGRVGCPEKNVFIFSNANFVKQCRKFGSRESPVIGPRPTNWAMG